MIYLFNKYWIALFSISALISEKGYTKIPSLIPLPQELEWNNNTFSISDTIDIYIQDTELIKASDELLDWLYGFNVYTRIHQNIPVKEKGKRIILRKINYKEVINPSEYYELKIDNELIELNANELDGALHGIRTLRQLLLENSSLAGCVIADWPAFKWRGFMHDVGRNFIPLDALKKQVKIMAAYKLNVFHWHLTEDIAWRMEIRQYPQLTEPETMIRNPGEYYTQKEAAEFVDYCKQLGITVIPEIDMPGHSDAFERAMGVDMQSEEGTIIVKNILHEVCKLFDVPYIHIGGDEVKITNHAFLPEMFEIVRSYGKEVIGWRPGGNLDNKVVQQLWTGNPKPIPGIKTLDSRHLYINHNDPLSGVIKTFNRKICDVDHGNEELLGAILCAWPDRRVSCQQDVIRMNGFYPSILAFAERSWRGGGYMEPTSSLDRDSIEQFEAFEEFENRLLSHRNKYFNGINFPYVRQTNLKWNIIEPFPNQGNLEAVFPPEKKIRGTYHFDGKYYNTFHTIGGTIWLRHMWHPMILGEFENLKKNSTTYAYTYVHSDFDQEVGMWISFHNPGRANADDTPESGKWDYKESRIWINDQEIQPPEWSKPGRKGHMEAPLIDESYEWRQPTKVWLKKGWNHIFLKLPISDFKSKHTSPVKWMFTAVFVDWDGTNVREVEGLEYSLKPD